MDGAGRHAGVNYETSIVMLRAAFGTGPTLAVFPPRWDERTFFQARGTTELDPKQTNVGVVESTAC